MRTGTIAAPAAALLTFAFTGFGAAAQAAPVQQPEQNGVAECMVGNWESTEVTVEHDALEDFEISGGEGATLSIGEDGTATLDFVGMERITLEGEVNDTPVEGYVEYRGEATGTVTTTEETEQTGTLEAEDVNWEDVQVTVVLTEPFDSRPLNQVPVEDLRQLAEDHGHMGALTPVLTESTYECENQTLTLTSPAEDGEEEQEQQNQRDRQDQHEAEVTWTFEWVAENQ